MAKMAKREICSKNKRQMMKMMLNQAYDNMGLESTQMVATIFDGIESETLTWLLSTHFAPGERVTVWAPNISEWLMMEYA